MELGANEEQLNFTTVYSIAKDGIAKLNLKDDSKDLSPLLDIIIKEVPMVSSNELNQKLLKAQPFNLGYDNFMGRLAITRIYEGVMKPDSMK